VIVARFEKGKMSNLFGSIRPTRNYDNEKAPVFHKDGTLPQNGEVLVFGSNLAGIHGAGAAKVAQAKFGAQYGVSWGFLGQSYAIPTKDNKIRTLPLSEIELYINKFLCFANDPFILNRGYFVTRVGCGLAGYKDSDIAPMFKGALNCSFAEQWREYLI
jgi:hypothetical protein